MRVQLIRPGWGNSTDNHYYPAEVLKRDAHVFEGVKMYTTDHKANEKSVRTEVAKIEAIEGFSDEGAPIARVVTLNPDFAEIVRHRDAKKQLDTLECSVLGEGTSRPFEKDGRKGKIIESITNAESVDWVTRAGAGGKALEIAESEPNLKPEGGNMPDKDNVIEVTPTPEPVQAAPVAEAVTTPAPAEPTKLSELAVTALLEAEKRLPDVSRTRLAEGQYTDGDAVQTAITKELDYLAKAVGAGNVTGLGVSPARPKKSPSEALAEANSGLDKAARKYGMELFGGQK
jgi:hypothetical protein